MWWPQPLTADCNRQAALV
jgi:uncharacterized protein YPO0396